MTELALDDNFRSFVLEPNAERSAAWDAWQREGPADEQQERLALMNDARLLFRVLEPQMPIIPEGAQELVWQRIQAQIHKSSASDVTPQTADSTLAHTSLQKIDVHKNLTTQDRQNAHKAQILPLPLQNPQLTWYAWAGIAAAVLVGISLGVLWTINSFNPSNVFVSTSGGGGRSTLTLPDGSVVVVGERSELAYSAETLKNGAVREVSLQGEAFFHVQPTARDGEKVKFRVRTETALIEVLGTQFNVNTRREQTAVVLQEGRVRILSPDGKRELAVLQPGERIEINTEGLLNRREVKTKSYTSWKDGKVFFDALPMSEVSAILRDSYNFTLVFEDSTLASKTFSGGIPADNMPLLKEILQETFNIRAELRGNSLFLSR
ncbi:MAG: FecR domain-containing protein [Ignavibacteria bacterium]|nr:FecR domain-containing protein [Ignavibacteria bacterium]